jgi:hypothetical protein
VRLWANRGRLRTIRTDGGHRRFLRQDVADLAARHKSPPSESASQLVVHSALGRTRMEIADGALASQDWYKRCDDGTREQHRQLGRRLLGVTMLYLNQANERAAVLQQARLIGREYGALTRKQNLSIDEAVRAFLYFRDTLLESVLQMRAVAPQHLSDDNLQTYRLLNAFANDVLIAMVNAHLAEQP